MPVILDPAAIPDGELFSDWVGNYVLINPNCEGCETPSGVLEIEAFFDGIPFDYQDLAWGPVAWVLDQYAEFPPPDVEFEIIEQEPFYTTTEDVCIEQGCAGHVSAPDVVELTESEPEGEPISVKRWWTLVEPDSATLGSAIQVEVRTLTPANPLPRVHVIAVYDDPALTGTPETDWDLTWRPEGWFDLGIYEGGIAEVYIDGVEEEAYADCLDYDSRVQLESDGCFPVVKGGTGVWVGVVVDCDDVDAEPIQIVVNRVGFESH